MDWGNPLILLIIIVAILAVSLFALAWHNVRLRREADRHQARLCELEGMQQRFQSQQEIWQQTSRLFFQSDNEGAVIEALLRAAMEISDAMGVSFVPLDDRGKPMAAIRMGNFPMPVPDAWLEYLASPEVRSACSQCRQLENVVRSCALLKGPFGDAMGLVCYPFRVFGIELGVLNLYLPEEHASVSEKKPLLQSLLEIASLALMAQRLRRKESQALDFIQGAQGKRNAETEKTDTNGYNMHDYKIIMEERARLAREIHDGLAQTLGFLKLQVAQMQGFLEKGDFDRLDKAIHRSYDALAAAYQDVRESIDALRLSPDGENGNKLANWIQQIVMDFEGSDALNPVEVIVKGLDVQADLPLTVQAQLIRIIQEAMSNVRKHSQAEHVWISCLERDGDLIIEVQDDGLGFDAEDVPATSKHGLRGMQERSELIGADFQIISQPLDGTTVRVRLPLSIKNQSQVGKQ